MFAEMAGDRHAVQRKWHSTRCHHQPPCFPESNDDWNVDREHGGESGSHARSRARCNTFHVCSSTATFLQSDHLYRFSEKDTAIEYFGKQLKAAGYNYYGNEPMYSGITGQEFAADIYFGVVYYQRLRHMVLDKFQVRTTGPVDPVTRQPVKVSLIPLPSFSSCLHTPFRGVSAPVVFDSERWSEMP
jgi:hypothetical protein